MIRRIGRSRFTALVVLLIVLALPGEPVLAALQQDKSPFAKKIKEANDLYENGSFDASIKILEESTHSPGFPQNLRVQAYELLAQNYLAKSNWTRPISPQTRIRGSLRKWKEFAGK